MSQQNAAQQNNDLLAKAKKATIDSRQPSQHQEGMQELAIAWLKGEVSLKGCQIAMGTASPYCILARALRHAYGKGLLQVTPISPNRRG